MFVIYSFCVLKMRHMLNQIGWLELRLQHILHILVQISNKFRWSNTNQQHNMKMWYMCHYTSWHTNHNVCWRVDFEHGPTWILDTNSMFEAWEWWKNHSGSLSIPQKYITATKENLTHLMGEWSQRELGKS